jgi:hypothetical protein
MCTNLGNKWRGDSAYRLLATAEAGFAAGRRRFAGVIVATLGLDTISVASDR